MIKKYFPHILTASFFGFFLVLGFFYKNNGVNALDLEKAKKKKAYYNNLYKELSVKTTKGTEVKLSAIKQKVVIIHFWASWCRPCVSEFASLNKLKKKLGSDKLFVLGVNNDTENIKKSILKTERKYKLSFESVIESKYDLTNKFGVTTVPASFVFVNGQIHKLIDEEFDFMNKKFVKSLD